MEEFTGHAQQIKTLSATKIQGLLFPSGSRTFYECANPFITRGLTEAASSYTDCLNNSLYGSKIEEIVDKLNFTPTWFGPPSLINPSPSSIDSVLTGVASTECDEVESALGKDWKGCFWAAPDSIISCECPEIGSKYLDYLKLRLNVATFWNTPKQAPILRKKFLDSVSYGPKITIVVAADLKVRPGHVINISVNSISGYSTDTSVSSLSTKNYYVISVKSQCTNSGVGETTITAVELVY